MADMVDSEKTWPEEEKNQSGYPGNLSTVWRNFSLLGLGIFVMLLSGQLLGGGAVMLAERFFPGWLEGDWGMWLVSYIPLYGIALPLGLLLFRKVPAVAPASGSWSRNQLLMLIPVCFCMMYAGNFAGIILTGLLQLIPGVTAMNPVLDITTGTALLPRLLVVSIAAPLIEEYIFRKQLIDRMQLYGQKTAVVVSAVMFGLFHGNLSQFFYATLLGLVFGYSYIKTGKLRYNIALHILINFLGGVVAPWFLEHLPLSPEAMADPEALVAALPWLLGFTLYALFLVGMSLAGLVLLCAKRREITFARSPLELPREVRFRTVWCNAGAILAVVGCLAMIGLSLFS